MQRKIAIRDIEYQVATKQVKGKRNGTIKYLYLSRSLQAYR